MASFTRQWQVIFHFVCVIHFICLFILCFFHLWINLFTVHFILQLIAGVLPPFQWHGLGFFTYQCITHFCFSGKYYQLDLKKIWIRFFTASLVCSGCFPTIRPPTCARKIRPPQTWYTMVLISTVCTSDQLTCTNTSPRKGVLWQAPVSSVHFCVVSDWPSRAMRSRRAT